MLIHSSHGSRRFEPAGRHCSAQVAGGFDDPARHRGRSRTGGRPGEGSADQALIAHLKLQIAKLNRERFGPHSELSKRLLDQLELQLEELEASASEDDLAAERAAAKTTGVAPFERKRPVRKRFPEHLPRERVVIPAPCSCPACARFLNDGRVCITNNAAERALRGIALGRKSWLFCGSDRGGQCAAVMYSLIGTAKLNAIDPQAWIADVLARSAGYPSRRLDELLPWNWRKDTAVLSQAA